MLNLGAAEKSVLKKDEQEIKQKEKRRSSI